MKAAVNLNKNVQCKQLDVAAWSASSRIHSSMTQPGQAAGQPPLLLSWSCRRFICVDSTAGTAIRCHVLSDGLRRRCWLVSKPITCDLLCLYIYIYHSDQNQEAEWRNVLFEVLELHELCVHATSEISLLWMSWLSYILWMSLQPCISSAADCTKCTLRIGVPIEFCSGCLWLMEPKYSACTVHPRTVSISV